MDGAVEPTGERRRAPNRFGERRIWLSALGALAVLICVIPPVLTLAQRYVVAETVQFVVCGIIGPALIVLGAPWRLLGLARSQGAPVPAGAHGGGFADWLADGRRHHPTFRRAGLFLLLFMAVALAWRLPVTMDALVRVPALAAVQVVSLLVAGTGLWLELVGSPPLSPRLPRPQRAAVSALAMWFIWATAYAVGMNTNNVYGAYGDLPGRALSLMADQELASGVMWVVAGCAFIPIVLVTMLGWLSNAETSDEEFQRSVRDEHQRAVVRGWARRSGAQS